MEKVNNRNVIESTDNAAQENTPPKNLITHEGLMQEAERLYSQQLAKGTKRVYASDWKIFNHWCQQHNHSAEKATPHMIALFLTHQFQHGFHPQTLNRRLAAIKFIFTQKNMPSPTESPIVRAILKGIKRDKNTKPSTAKKALTADILKQMVDCCPNTLRGVRDKALLLVGFAGGYRRSELAAIQLEDITFQKEGMDIKLHRSKTDQEGKGELKAILKSKEFNYCPIFATQQWIAKSQITQGPLWRGITKSQLIKTTQLTPDTIYNVIKHYSFRLGYEIGKSADFSPHSLRSGFVTSALEKGAAPSKIMEVTKHKTLQSLQKYIKHAERYKHHAGENLL